MKMVLLLGQERLISLATQSNLLLIPKYVSPVNITFEQVLDQYFKLLFFVYVCRLLDKKIVTYFGTYFVRRMIIWSLLQYG